MGLGLYRTAVVIPNYNGVRFLPDCMKALERQSIKDFYIVVIDNGSKDGSQEWLHSWASLDPDKRALVINSDNFGFARAVNQGIAWAFDRDCKYVVLLNNDTKIRPHFLERLIRAMDEDKKGRLFAVSSRMLKMDNLSIIDDAGDEFTVLGWQFQRGLNKPAKDWGRPGRVFSACAGASIYRLEALKKTGLFDEGHFAYLEDIDLSFRANLYGYKILYLPAAICLHVGSGTSGSKYNDFKVRLSARNSLYVLYKNMPLPMLLLNMQYIFLGYLIKLIFFTRKGFGPAYLSGIKEGLKDIKEQKLKRAKFNKVPLWRYIYIELRLFFQTFRYIKQRLGRG